MLTPLTGRSQSMEEKNVAIQVHGLQKSYKKLQVLKGVDFDVARGSIFALLGSNGAGKTTIAQRRHMKVAGKVADDLLGRFGVADAAERRVSTYSGGMRRRLDIAMSLIGNPRIIFLDEPTTGLDPEGRIEVWQVIQNLADSGTTVFLTTQHLDEAEKLADRIAILHNGTIIVSGTLEELRKLFPPAKVEYVERQPTLEEIFLAIVGSNKKEPR